MPEIEFASWTFDEKQHADRRPGEPINPMIEMTESCPFDKTRPIPNSSHEPNAVHVTSRARLEM
jgi:hypothetical protein